MKTEGRGNKARTVLITGGAGFIGSNLAERLLTVDTARVRVFDNLSRSGVERNLQWLRGLQHGGRLEFVDGDVRDAQAVRAAVDGVSEIYHLAAQVAVTTSIDEPRHDLGVNVIGTFNVLEAARLAGNRPFVLFTSTNKVYGSLERVPVEIAGDRFRAIDPTFDGVDEAEALDFHSPYGCSKGAADQYVRDYARIYDLPTVVFRMSCIAGPRQFGTEDQGWVAHFVYSVLEGKPITIYGQGFQVRDILHVSDLVDAMLAARDARERTASEIYNVGGGPARAVSLLEMLAQIERETDVKPRLRFSGIRPGDQPLYVSKTSKLTAHTGWAPRHSPCEILQAIHSFWQQNRGLLEEQRGRAAMSEREPELIGQEVG